MADSDILSVTHDLSVLLSSEDRDFLIRNNGDQVKISSLNGKTVGLFFSALRYCVPLQDFTPDLLEFYQEVAFKGDFEVVFMSCNEDYDSFKDYFSKMPWLAIPHSESNTLNRVNELLNLIEYFPGLIIFDSNGNITTVDGMKFLMEYGIDAYPFTSEIITSLLDKEEEAKKNHFLSFVLAGKTRDYLVSNDGNQVHVSELEGKTVALYFWASDEFTPTLIDVYNKLKAKSEKFEIVSIFWPSEQDDEEEFYKEFKTMPWLTFPFKDKTSRKLIYYFDTNHYPTLVIIGPDGKILKPNAVKLIDNYGVEGYPYTPERLDQIDKARLESQTLESLLVSGDKDFVIAKDGSKVPVSELVGKTILLYFLCSWCRVCTRFTPKLIEIYQDIKAKNDDFEVIFICNCEQDTFDELLSSMPWLALPFDDDARRKTLMYRFKIRSTPNVVVIGPSGQTATSKSRELINVYGANAYPFTEEHLQHLEEQMDEIAKGWPKKLKHELHAEHEFSPTRHESVYWCEACLETGIGLYFKCEHCYFGLHPKCALKKHYEAIEEFFCEGNESHKV